jgi:hypothetical protein
MTGPLKRTALKSSPEDAAFYRKFHDSVLSGLRRGTPREQVLQDLAAQGVPEKTANRIVVAGEQELALSKAARGAAPGAVWKTLGFIALVWGAVAGYLCWQLTRDGTFHWKYLAAAGVIALFLTARVVGRLLLRQREPIDLPPPP